ncbi:DUF2848 domain-containing protein [Robbsia andropogonis]|uniref:DUF2848 domain-containing protein n=1 Tax=Robbsia andropogonis TaxID=28092 RepID=UPI0004641551|nr:DUF2848 domain-containing protein [Robbsia andropogonis]MCP1119559.1 DUF2848 domain-containing protein [Robbsia andropogonis]MCP1129542.1 DUF2848 domain-containing protein [Robbsia andropogonis]
MSTLTFEVHAAGTASTGGTPIPVQVDHLVIAGWAGRDPVAIQAHIDELAAIGVAPPSSTPCFYRVADTLLTQSPVVQMLGARSGGEIECVLMDSPAGILVAIGSDHTDREIEAYGVAVSKQVCAKPISRTAWRYADVAAHWDQLQMQSWLIKADGTRRHYQSGTVAGLLPPPSLWSMYGQAAGARMATPPPALPAHTAMYSGTLAVHGELAAMTDGDSFVLELTDPVLDRRLTHRYTLAMLPIVS